MAPRKENQPLQKERKIVQASREDIFPPLAGANAPAPYAACGRKASPKSESNGTKRRESGFVGFRKTAPIKMSVATRNRKRLECVREVSVREKQACVSLLKALCVFSFLEPSLRPSRKKTEHNCPLAVLCSKFSKRACNFVRDCL